ncbi:hypothetical protein [Microbacterium sp. NPDC055665]
MPAPRRSTLPRSLSLGSATAALGVLLASGAPAAAVPGTPGVMAAPTVILYEGFEGPVSPATPDFVQTIADYDDGVAPPVPGYVGTSGERYRADPAWNGQFCNGLIVAGDDVSTVPTASQASDCEQDGWNQSRVLAETLGAWTSHPDYPYPAVPRPEPGANHAVSSYTQGESPAGVMAATVVPVTVGHYYTATVDVAQANCWTTNPVDLAVRLDDGVSEPVAAFPGPIAACDLPVHQINGNNVGTFRGLTSLLARSTSVEVVLSNDLGGGGGDDNAFDNLALIDTTPQLDAVIAAPPIGDAYAADQTARLLFTVTNTHLAGSPAAPSGAKPEWSFDLALPPGLLPAEDPAIETNCPNGELDLTSTSIVGRGSLGPTDVSCSLALDLVSSGGEYVLDPAAYELTGLLAPAATSARFDFAPGTPEPSPSSGPVLADSGADPLPALLTGALAVALGAVFIRLSATVRGRRAR